MTQTGSIWLGLRVLQLRYVSIDMLLYLLKYYSDEQYEYGYQRVRAVQEYRRGAVCRPSQPSE